LHGRRDPVCELGVSGSISNGLRGSIFTSIGVISAALSLQGGKNCARFE
jgi:hypothetical protein